MNTEKVFHQLSESQKSIWYLEKAYPGTSLNIIAGNLRLKGEINYQALAKAVNLFVKKNESMRLRVVEQDGDALQYVSDYEEFDVDFVDFSNSGGLKDLFLWDEGKTRTPFNIIDNPLFYCALYKISDDEGGILMKMHHLISDAWTLGLTVRQLIDFYTKLKNGEPVDESLNPSYIEHLAALDDYEKSARFEKDKVYWLKKFETLPEMTVLKQHKNNEATIHARRKTLITPLKLSNKIREFCSDNNVSVFTLFMAALAIYINRVTGTEDIILGTTTLNRTSLKEKETTGMFVSVAAPVCISVNDSMDFKTFAKMMLKENTDVLRHQKYPYNCLLRDLKKIHKFSGGLFDIVLSYQNSKFHKNETNTEYFTKWIFSGCQVESLIISINDREDSGNLIIDYDFLTDVFDIKEIEFIHQHIIRLLWHALDNPTRKISKLEMISEKEKNTILHEFNDTYADYPRDKTLHQIFEEQAEKTPANTAVIYKDRRMTYAELNEKANSLAHTLRRFGIGPDKIVGIMARRSFEMIIGLLAILKAGGAYMPIDPDYPAERKNYMIKNSCTDILLLQHALLDSVEFSGLKLDLDDQISYSDETGNLPRITGPRDLAYVIYTSGSTGYPKGVMLEHNGVVNRINWMQKKYPLEETSVILQKTTYSFDVSVWELFWWSFAGASVCLLNAGDEKDPEAIIAAIEAHEVTTMHFVPSMLSVFLNYLDIKKNTQRLSSLKHVFASGEALTVHQVQMFNHLLHRTNGTLLSNLYGPTEATVDVSYFDCSPLQQLGTVPIGKPIDNISLYIFDKNQNLLPVGIPGELYIGGVGVARGYLNNPELTTEKFVINPYKRNEILYRTGDHARWFPMGDIEFLGRMDYQVKIRGFRIEIGEIEAKLLTHEAVAETVVKQFDDENGQSHLTAFIVTKKEITVQNLYDYLAGTLPEYMVPSSIVFLDKIPLSSNGKVDRNALVKHGRIPSEKTEYILPENQTETALAEIWRSVLGLERVGMLDEYSALGGDSLNAIKIITEIHKRFGFDISPRRIFEMQTIRRIADYIESLNRQQAGYRHIPVVPPQEYYNVSSAQKRLFILNQIDGGTTYNLPGGLVIEGTVDRKLLGDILNTIIRRHDSLRTSFAMRDGQPIQIIHNHEDIDLDYIVAYKADYEDLMADFLQPFDLRRAPLFRARLVGLSDRTHLLMFDMHHIIADGASVNNIIREMTELLNDGALPDLSVQYKDYSAWHNMKLQSDEMKRHEEYWLEKMSGEIPVLNMPIAFMRPARQSFKGDKVEFIIDETLTSDLRALNARTGSTPFMVLLAAYNTLLSKYAGQEDVIVGAPVEGRLHEDLSGLVGMFVNTLALRSYPAGHKSFEKYLDEIKDEVLGAFDHQDYPFEILVDKVGIARNAGRNPLFDTTFVMQNMSLRKFNAGGLSIKPYSFNHQTSKFDLTLEAIDKGSTIGCTIEYCTDLFEEKTIQRLSKHYLNILKGICDHPEAMLCDIDMLSSEERFQLLNEWNDTDAEYPEKKTIHQIFEEQAALTPGNTALIFQNRKMTYAELNAKANRLARTLRANGVGADDIVGIMTERSFETVVAILGVLKAGGVYLPIDPDYPSDRIRYMLQNSGAGILLTKRSYTMEHAEALQVLYLDDETSYNDDGADLKNVNKPSDLAYIIYTSGSTGQPKGVMIEHRNVVRLLFNEKFQFDFNESDVWTFFHSYCFDFSVWEMYGALLYGGKLVIVTKEATIDTRKFLSILKSEKVTVLNQTPSAFYNLVTVDQSVNSDISSLKYVIFGGEALKPAMLEGFYKKYPKVNLINMYGITETTVHVTYKALTADDIKWNISNVGRVIPTLKVFILDKDSNLLPVGVPGEICVGGAGVARGYLNNEILTKEKFVSHDYLSRGKIYRSGDLGRYLPNGDIEYLGRIDSQVKIRGFRVEIGEIENALIKHSQIDEAIVTVYETGAGDKKLCAYFRSNEDLPAKDITKFLSATLPEYMIPAYSIRIAAFPLNKNGKIDKSALPKPNQVVLTGSEIVAPRNVTEELIAGAWSQVLEIPEIGIDDNFFELGGDSLSAIKAVSMIKLGINLVDFYTNPTVRLLAEKLVSDKAGTGMLVRLTRRRKAAGTKLICFPYGGGSALAFRDINDALTKRNADIDLYAANLPGHDYGVRDELAPFGHIAEKIAEEIRSNLSGDIILYGHCVGSALMLTTAGLLEKMGIKPKSLFIGGVLAPKFIDLYGSFYKPWSLLSDKSIISFLKKIGLPKELLAEDDYVKYIIKAFRHDARCFTEYLYSFSLGSQDKLTTPVCLIVGDEDSTTRAYARRFGDWKKYCEDVKLIVLNGANHYFINTHADQVVDCLIQT